MNRPLPHDLDAERALLGSLMLIPALIDDVRPILKNGDIYREEHKAVFDCLLDMSARGVGIDLVTVCAELEARPDTKHGNALVAAGGFAEVSRLLSGAGTSHPLGYHAANYAKTVARHGARRRQIWAAEKFAEGAYDATLTPEENRARMERWVGQTTPLMARTIDHVGAGLEAYIDKQALMESEESDFAIPAALKAVDDGLAGYTRGECTVFSAPTGEGKTAFAFQELLDKARRGFGAAYVGTEMYAHACTERLIAHDAQINLTQVRRGFNPRYTDLPYARQSWEEYRRARDESIERIYALPLHIMAPVMDVKARRVTRPDLTPNGIRAALRAYADKHPLDFIVVDYLTNLEIELGRGSADRSLIVEHALRTLREMAIELGAALLVLAQLNRKAAEEREPRLHHLEQSTGIEKSADNVWLMYAPDADNAHIRTILGAKGRNVSKGKVDGIHFDGPTQTFTDDYSRRMNDF